MFVPLGFCDIEDYTEYTEVDSDNSITNIFPSNLTTSPDRNSESYLYYDYGVDFFGDFVHYFDLKITVTLSGGSSLIPVWCLSNVVDDINGIKVGNGDAIWCYVYNANAFYLVETYGTNSYQTGAHILVLNTQYYLTVNKTSTELDYFIYSDAARTSVVFSGTKALNTDYSFRYVFGAQSYNSGASGYTGTIVLSNLDLNIPPVEDEYYLDFVSCGTNSTVYDIEENCNFTSVWDTNSTMEYGVFSWNYTGSFVNDSVVALNGCESFNVTKYLGGYLPYNGTCIGWYMYANCTASVSNSTGLNTFVLTYYEYDYSKSDLDNYFILGGLLCCGFIFMVGLIFLRRR